MHETRADLDALQRLLDDSYSRAGNHLRSILTPERRLGAERLCALLRRVCILHLATVSSAGEPRVAPIDGVFFRARFYVGASAESLRARHLHRNPAVSAAHTRGERLSVLVHGTAVEVDCADPGETPLRDYFREAYGWKEGEFGSWGKAPFWRIEPRFIFAAALDLALLSADP
jgi:hypothetical protein